MEDEVKVTELTEEQAKRLREAPWPPPERKREFPVLKMTPEELKEFCVGVKSDIEWMFHPKSDESGKNTYEELRSLARDEIASALYELGLDEIAEVLMMV